MALADDWTRKLQGPMRRCVAWGLAVQALYVAQGAALAWALMATWQGAPAKAVALFWLALLAVLVRAVAWWAQERAARQLGQQFTAGLRHTVLAQMLRLGPAGSVGARTAQWQLAAGSGIDALEGYYKNYQPAVWIAVLGVGGTLAVLAWCDPATAALLAVFALAQPLIEWLWLRRQMPAVAGVFEAMGCFGVALLDALQGLLTLKVFGASARWRAQLAEHAAQLRLASMQALRATLLRTGLTTLVGLGGVAVVLAMNAHRMVQGSITPAVLLLSLFLAREMFRPIDRLEKAFQAAWMAQDAWAPIEALMAAEPAVLDAPVDNPSHQAMHTGQPAHPRGQVAFEQVCFRYPGTTQDVLQDLSLQIAPGEWLALVGPSGAGKSSLAALLLRFFDPTAGVVRISGQDLREWPLAQLRQQLAWVPQECRLFAGSIASNLRLAKPDATVADMRQAAQAAAIDAEIMAMPQAYDTPVGEGGRQLSGGQRQRLALARALLRQAPILVLDEPSAFVDPQAQAQMMHSLRQLAGKVSVLMTAHRLETAMLADRVVVMEAGRIVEQGPPATLAKDAGSAFARLWQAQQAELADGCDQADQKPAKEQA